MFFTKSSIIFEKDYRYRGQSSPLATNFDKRWKEGRGPVISYKIHSDSPYYGMYMS